MMSNTRVKTMVMTIKPIVVGNFKNLTLMYPKIAEMTIKMDAIE
jgi:hypothetical protein